VEQLELVLNSKHQKRKMLIVDTMAKDSHKQHIINIGLEYVAQQFDADVCCWWDTIENIEQYDVIGFNIIYPLFLLNVCPFLHRHRIQPFKNKRKRPFIIAGGMGVSNTNDALRDIVDVTFKGEADGNTVDNRGWSRMDPIISEPICWTGTRKTAVVEVDRGCKWRCAFCEYSHVLGGAWRCKDINLLRDQLKEVVAGRKIKRITLRSANLAAYPQLDELFETCLSLGVYQGWADFAIRDADRLLKWLDPLRITTPKIGLESFDEATRERMNKPCTDEYLHYLLSQLIYRSNHIHIYLIYGLPGDNYDRWIEWAKIIGKMWRATIKKVRIDFSLTNFNPCRNTPVGKEKWVDFKAKDIFLDRWTEVLKEEGFYKRDWTVEYGRNYGRNGRKEVSYDVIMSLRHDPPEVLTNKLIGALPRGIGRSMRQQQALRFQNYNFNAINSINF